MRYGGPVVPQAFDREAIQVGQAQAPQEQRIEIPLQPRYLYSNRSYWYPQATVTDYATATIRVTVPNDYDAIATGQPVESPTLAPGGADNQRRRKTFVFEASRPVRYLAVIVSRLNRLDNARISAGSSDVSLYVQSTPRAAGAGQRNEREDRRNHRVLRLAPRRRSVSEFLRSRWQRAIALAVTARRTSLS